MPVEPIFLRPREAAALAGLSTVAVMSVESVVRKDGSVVWRVLWRQAGRNRSKVLGRKRDRLRDALERNARIIDAAAAAIGQTLDDALAHRRPRCRAPVRRTRRRSPARDGRHGKR